MSAKATEIDRILGEAAAIQGGLLFWATDDVGAVEKSQQTLEAAPQEHECARSTALMHMGGGYQVMGVYGEAERLL